MKLFEIPIEIYDRKQAEVTGEEDYKQSVMTVDAERIQYAFRDGRDLKENTVIGHMGRGDCTTVVMPYDKFIALWKSVLVGGLSAAVAGVINDGSVAEASGSCECVLCGGRVVMDGGVAVCEKCGFSFKG